MQLISEIFTRLILCLTAMMNGKIGEYLFQQLADFNDSPNAHWTSGESWGLGDSCTVGVLLHDNQYNYELQEAPEFDNELGYIHNTGYRKIRVYHKIDSRMVLEDFYSKLALNCRSRRE